MQIHNNRDICEGMAIIKVHGIPFSTCTARVLLCLHEKGPNMSLTRSMCPPVLTNDSLTSL
ncbi:hypothetical protein PanWU01x14_007870 [Parasponia andersonii]|uniref:Uncharacterized protein n=1 Tax=Parasponia andersonii TaxID=3476 RepID=A0A2P5E468_PARAD|nr:hypothetical protein PanWU01x14_007870 [Parasponia andersonii]